MQRYKTSQYIAINSHFPSRYNTLILHTVLSLATTNYGIQSNRETRERIFKANNQFSEKVIGNTDASVKDHVDTLAEYKDYIWSNKDIDPHEIRSMRESILNHFALGESVINKRKRLTKILAIPYFGRIDFWKRKKTAK